MRLPAISSVLAAWGLAVVLTCISLSGAGAEGASAAAGTGAGAGIGAARLDIAHSSIVAEGRDRGGPRPLVVTLATERLLPYRVLLLGEPVRLVVDIEGLDAGDSVAGQLPGAELVSALRWGEIADNRTRIVIELPGPMAVASVAGAKADGRGTITVRLVPTTAEAFRPDARGDALPALFGLPEPAPLPEFVPRRPGPLRVTIDPGHGGFDPGAVVGETTEAALMLTVAREVAGALREAGVEVTLTRDDDRFLPLEQRMTLARAASADVFLSLHADALPEGEAAGAAIYTWSEGADDSATARLAARHDRDDLLAGLDLSGADDTVAGALMDIARIDTSPRSQNLAQFLVSEFAIQRIAIRNRPVKRAAFSVLKAPDIPSVLIETGFLSDPGDRANLADPHWRAELASAIARAITAWAEDDAMRAPLLRH